MLWKNPGTAAPEETTSVASGLPVELLGRFATMLNEWTKHNSLRKEDSGCLEQINS